METRICQSCYLDYTKNTVESEFVRRENSEEHFKGEGN